MSERIMADYWVKGRHYRMLVGTLLQKEVQGTWVDLSQGETFTELGAQVCDLLHRACTAARDASSGVGGDFAPGLNAFRAALSTEEARALGVRPGHEGTPN